MRSDVVFTLTGPDRVGIVEEVTRAILDLGGNIENSRMARLGGEFAILMLASLPAEKTGALTGAFAHLSEQGYMVTTSQTQSAKEAARAGRLAYNIDVQGADHEGIIHQVAQGLSDKGINIESMETATVSAPVSGAPLFTMRALVSVPLTVVESDWIAKLTEAGDLAGVDIEVVIAE